MSKTSMPAESSVESGLGWWERIGALWPTKVWLAVLLNLWFWGCYLFLSRHPLFPIHTLPMTGLDRWAGFRPHPWAWIYESNFLLFGSIPWLMASRQHLRRYVVGFVLLTSVSFVIFVFFPVASPRPTRLDTSAFLIFITRVDGPLNAFPSLHAGCLIYVLALARRLFGPRLSPLVAAILLVWAALILFATLATKQHYAVDLLAGGLLGWAADWFAWHNSACGDIASVNTRRRSGVVSQAG
jgi:membrane-associated phospholipid phosphatase